MLEEGKGGPKDGLRVFKQGEEVKFKTTIMFRGKLREGIKRIKGDIVVQKTTGEDMTKIRSVDLKSSEIVESSFKLDKQGRYRLGLYGVMTLSTGEEKLFITKSFPFEIGAE